MDIDKGKGTSGKKAETEADLIRFIDSAGPEQLEGMNRDEAKAMVREFHGFTTYFSGFYENRKNMYSTEEKPTGIAYRLINENLPKFVDNMDSFQKIAAISEMEANISNLYSDFEEYLNVRDIREMFQLDYYNNLLTQKQIDVYNAIIGGKTSGEHGKKIKGINEYINLYNQQHKESKLPKLKVLFKQILSDRNAISWLPEEFHNDQEVLYAIKDCYERLKEKVLDEKGLENLLHNLSEYDDKGIFLCNDLQLTDISQKMFGSWNIIQDAILKDLKSIVPVRRNKETEDDYENRMLSIYKKTDSFSIQYINSCLNRFVENNAKEVQTYFAELGDLNTKSVQHENLFDQIEKAYAEIADLLNEEYPTDKNLAQDKDNILKIKIFLDTLKSLQHFVKPLLGKGDENDKDEKFYGEFSPIWKELDQITPLYNMVRNYMTRKPYSQDKIKLNFGNSQLLGGWDANKESDYASILLRRSGKYYLAIMDKKEAKVLSKVMPSEGECYEKMVYKLLPGANKMLPKVFFAKSRLAQFSPSKTLLDNYKKGTHKKGKNFNIADCHALIDYFKQSIDKHEDWSKFGFRFSDTSIYEDMSGFYREVEQQGYKISFTNVSIAYINQLVEEGKMYLFQIYNKDFSEYSKGTPNMHTLYWKALFDERNLEDVVYKLNGQAELFFRKKSLNVSYPTHPANQPILNKNNKKKESLFEYDLIKNRRYTVDKFMFHVPITMNFKNSDAGNINKQVREYLRSAEDTHIIGIDRGERHLLYLVVIDKRGNIIEQYTLNEIVNEYNGNTYSTNYHDLLDVREEDRMKARQSWQTIETIKELKEGYLSQVIHKITQLMVKYHAIVVLEDLNMGFMRGRQKVEKQVYQKFEKMLIDKLNYLVDKRANPSDYGGLLNAYQLTSKFESFQKLRAVKQSGFLFYVPAWNTSKIDPVTGFVNLLDTRYKNIESAKEFFGKFQSIRYNADKNWFEFDLDYTHFGKKAEGTRTHWTLCTQGNRIKTWRNPEKNLQWDNQEIELTENFKELFAKYQIDITDNLKEQICKQETKDFYEGLLSLLKLTLQMRNSKTGTEVDYLISPIADEEGCFYDSRICGKSLPENADANGAFNIARKGLMLVRQIKETNDLSTLKFDISNKSWLQFAQTKPYKNE